MIFLKTFLCAVFGYLIGGVNPSYIIARIKGFDIRKKGSGNAGASNAVITMGKAIGISSAIFDILKATAAFLLAPLLFPDLALAAVIAGASCIVGHIYPIFMRFKGGKGLACLGGVILAIDWRFFLILLAAELILVFVVDYICFVPITASFILPLVYGFFGDGGKQWLIHGENGWPAAAVLGAACLVILFRHVENIRRIINGKEMHLSFLWSKNKDAEIARVTGEDASEK